jgi:superfamily II DNA or RNA helicase
MSREKIQEEALKATEGQHRVTIVLATGVGKTLVGLLHLEREYSPLKNILVVAPKRSIIAEWRVQAIKFKKERLLSNTTFTTYLSLNKHDPLEYDIVYLDEAHNLLDSHRGFLENYHGKILGLTGTPPKRNDSEKGRLVNEFCPIVYEYLIDDAVDAKILNDYKIIVHKVNLNNTHKNVKVDTKTGGFFTTESANYSYWSNRVDRASPGKSIQIARIMRMKALMSFPSKERYAKLLAESIKSKCIIFANTQEQADRICSYSYHSGNSESSANLSKFKKGEIDKLSCVLQLSEGVNIPDLKQGIIMHAYGNERKSSQRIGRMLRLNPDDTATIHILCYTGTIDEKWVEDSLEGYDQKKVLWKDYNIKLY